MIENYPSRFALSEAEWYVQTPSSIQSYVLNPLCRRRLVNDTSPKWRQHWTHVMKNVCVKDECICNIR